MKAVFKIPVLLYLFFGIAVESQKISDSALMKKAALEIYDNPDHTIEIGENLLKKDNDIKTSIDIYMLLSTANIAKRNFDESLKYILKAKELSEKTNNAKSQASVLISVAIQYQQMELFSKSLETLNEADHYLVKIPENATEKYIETARSYAIRGMIYKSQSILKLLLKNSGFQSKISKKFRLKKLLIPI
jgi:tetratricopeptide (TPR) repeat protein